MGTVSVKVEQSIAIITLNRPPANALSTELLQELSEAFDAIEKNEEAKVIILHGEGRFFAAGADIKEFTQFESGDKFTEAASYGQQLFNRIEYFSKPVIAAIHGAALGGGLELAMACHIRLATTDCKLGLPELQLGLIPGFGGTQRLPRIVGQSRATELILTSEPITGVEAVSLGLVNSAFEEHSVLMEEAYNLASKIAQKSSLTTKLALEALTFAKDENFSTGLKEEANLFGIAGQSSDGKEGVQAFIEKRKPDFKNK